MKQFCCGDVVPGCNASFQAPDEAGLFVMITAHARRDHGLIDIPEALVAQVRSHIRDVPAAA